MANRKDASGDQSPGLRQRATIPGHSGFAARGEARELADVARKQLRGSNSVAQSMTRMPSIGWSVEFAASRRGPENR
jgi:hypothetical protein